MRYLFFFTIGPVQGFIAQARKTHDLFAGSKLLSHLSHVGIYEFIKLTKEFDGYIMLPLTNASKDKIPNRFVGRVNVVQRNDIEPILEKIGKKVEMAVRNALIKEFDKLNNIADNSDARNQIKNLLEIYWLFIKEDAGYAVSYNKGEKLMGSIKNQRSFSQIKDGGELGRKCEVDGERNVIVYRKRYDEKNTNSRLFTEMTNNIKVLEPEDYGIDKIWDVQHGEGISAVTYLKRKYLSHAHDFPSTAAISLHHLKLNKDCLKPYNEFERLIKAKLGHTDDQLYFKENINEKVLSKTINAKKLNIEELINEFSGKLNILIDKASQANLKFLKYYAIISFDGDNMGKWFSGAYLEKTEKLDVFHLVLSKQLKIFSDSASEFVNKYGKTVFAGEDFLGFVNLKYLIEVISKLQELWKLHINDVLQESNDFKILNNENLSFSAGIVVAHYKEPLGFVLQQVREAASLAKKNDKNRFSLQIMKHTGNSLQANYSFKSDALFHINRIIDQLSENFSNTFIIDFVRDIACLGDELDIEFIKTEFKRSIKRACKINRSEGESDEVFFKRKDEAISQLSESIIALLKMNVISENGHQIVKPVENFSQMLAICDFIQRKTC